jgi:serine/threonine protein kinase
MSEAPALLDHRYQVYSLESVGSHVRRYAGRHVALDLPVRITALRPTATDAAASAYDTSRFWTLAQKAVSLRHPVLPRLRDCFRAGDDYIIVDDAPGGETLAERIERLGCLTLRETLALGLRLCDALAYAQQICADLIPFTTITPYTVAFLLSGQVALTELGSWRWLGVPYLADDPQIAPHCAPEVGGHAPLDARADVYGIAAIMYHALTGPVPAAWNQAACPHDTSEPAIPPALSQVFEHALAADPAVRYASAEHLGRAIAMAARIVLPSATLLPNPIARRRRRAKSATAPATREDEARLVTPVVASAAHSALLSGPIQIASERVHLPISPPLRNALGRLGAIAESAIQSRA